MSARTTMAALRAVWRAPPRGVALVEFGLAAPILILLIVGLIDLGLAFYTALQVQGAASAGAQYASVHGFNSANIAAAVRQATNISGMNASPIPSEVCACPTSGTGGLQNIQSLPSSGVCTGVSCAGFGCTVSSTTTCPAGLYVKVNAFLVYRPLLPYPWATTPLTLTGQAYRRLQ